MISRSAAATTSVGDHTYPSQAVNLVLEFRIRTSDEHHVLPKTTSNLSSLVKGNTTYLRDLQLEGQPLNDSWPEGRLDGYECHLDARVHHVKKADMFCELWWWGVLPIVAVHY